MSYFVTGTDTGVGKTLTSCALLQSYAARGKRVAGFKPVAAGCDAQGHNEDALALRAASSMPLTYGQVNPYCFSPPIAPHIASVRGGVRIELARIMASYRELAGQADEVIVEGAGGFLVPLNETQTFADLACELKLPVILVVGMRLGCLNHALLSAEAIRARGLRLAAWVANVLEAEMSELQMNIDALVDRMDAPCLGVIPFMKEVELSQVRLDIGLLENRKDA